MERNIRSGFVSLATLVVFAACVTPAAAGPPLVCHPFEIGGARSLPWVSPADHGTWNSPATDYDLKRLADDTISLLSDGTPVIVRMETLRRAAIYASKNAAAASALLSRMKARIESPGSRVSGALHLFDYGYLLETMRQAVRSTEEANWASNVDGYLLIQKALRFREHDAQMQFAASIVTLFPKRPGEHKGHFRLAVSGAKTDPLLAQNLLSVFGEKGGTLADLQAMAASIGRK